MIINVTYGGSASDAARYIEGAAKEHGRDVPGTEDRATLLGGQGFGFPLETRDDARLALDVLRRDVELQASNTKPVENTVIHASMSWPQGYEPSREEMLEASEHLAKAWGMEAHRRISWSHEETKHRHIHTLFGSIHPDTGYAHHDHELNDRAQRAAIEWERKHGIPPTRQKDHDKAGAAEASDHARSLELSKNADGSISRRSLDRALALGGHFGPARTAQRNEFIARLDLTRFPAQEFFYSSKPLAQEKAEYIRENRKAASTLAHAYDREATERARGVGRLYEDHSFEKTSKPLTQEERGTSVGITNDFLDWPWKKAGEVIKKKWQDLRPDRDFGKEVEEKGWEDPGVKRQWEKKYGSTREEKREPSWEKPSPQQAPGEKTEAEKAAEMEEARVENWKIQRERNDNPVRAAETPPWRKDEQRTEQWRQQKEDERDEVNSTSIPKLSRSKDQVYRPQQDRERPPQEKSEPVGQQAQESTLSKWKKEWERYRGEGRLPAHDQPEPAGRETPALPRPREVPMSKFESHDHEPQARETKWDKEFREREREGKAEQQFQGGIDKATQQDGREPSEETIDRMNKDAIERDERKLPHYRRPFEPEESREEGHEDGTARKGRQDRTQAGQPGILPGGSHEHGSLSEQFWRQLDESLRDIKPPKREIGKDRERER